jgi:hypothetical protein
MSKKVLLVLVGIIVVGGGIAGLIFSKDSKSTEKPVASIASEAADNNETKVKNSLNALSTDNQARQCSFVSKADTAVADGKMFTDGKGRAYMIMNGVDSSSGPVNTLILNGKVYLWSETKGKTFGILLEKTPTSSTPSSVAEGKDRTNQNFDFACKKWNVVESQLTAPTNIEFKSVSF